MWREKENVFCQEVDVVKDKDLEDVTLEQPDVLSIIQGLRKLVKTDSVCICFVTIHHYSALLWFECWFSFSLFYILLFSAHIVNINAAKSSRVLDKYSLNIFMYFFKVQVVI